MTNITPQIRLLDGRPVTSSRELAVFFHKQHQHVTQKVEKVDCSEEFLTSNFSLVNYNHRGNSYKEYLITRDGFTFLAMGFTGKKAAQFKEMYIKSFNDMEAQLQKQQLQQESQLTGLAALTERDKQNLKQAVGVFVDCLASKRPIFEIRALIQYISNSANEFNWDQAINEYLPFGLDRVIGLLADNESAVVEFDAGHRGFEVRKVNAQQYSYIEGCIEAKEKPQYRPQLC